MSEKRSEVMAESVRESERVKDGESERGEGCKSVEGSQAFLYCDVFCNLSNAALMSRLLKFLLGFLCLIRFLVEISNSLKPQKLSVQPKKPLLAAETIENSQLFFDNDKRSLARLLKFFFVLVLVVD